MRKLTMIFAMLMIAIYVFGAGALTTNAQEYRVGDFIYVDFAGEIDSTETIKSNEFDLYVKDKYGQGMIDLQIASDKLTKSASGDTLNVIYYLYGSNDAVNYTVVDTIATRTTETLTNTVFSFNSKKFPHYKVYFTGSTGNYSDVAVWLRLVFFAPYMN